MKIFRMVIVVMLENSFFLVGDIEEKTNVGIFIAHNEQTKKNGEEIKRDKKEMESIKQMRRKKRTE